VNNDNTEKCYSLQSTLIFMVRFTQNAAVVYKIAVCYIIIQLTVYNPVDAPSSVSRSGIKIVIAHTILGICIKNQ
jgi:hypothetical protein